MYSNRLTINVTINFAINENKFIKNQLINLVFDENDEFMKLKTNHIFILDDSTIIFHKVFSPACNYIPKKDLMDFLYSDKKFYFKDTEENLCGEEFMKFNNNFLIFNNLIYSGNFDSIQNVIFKLSNNQLLQFKKEFEKLFSITENNLINNLNALQLNYII